MINIDRDTDVPSSLDTQEIQDYIRECVSYKNDPENLSKPQKPTSYRTGDLLQAFDRCFYAKCYLTEERFANSWPMDVEHFIPQSEDPQLVYEWTNLLPAEHGANMSKPRITPSGGYLDPSNVNDDVESQIVYSLTGYYFKPHFDPRDSTNVKESNTSYLLNRLHNGHNDDSIKRTVDLRHSIQKKCIKILEKICDYRSQSTGSQKEAQLRNELKELLSRRSSFTMLCRSIPAVIQLNEDFPDTFFD